MYALMYAVVKLEIVSNVVSLNLITAQTILPKEQSFHCTGDQEAELYKYKYYLYNLILVTITSHRANVV